MKGIILAAGIGTRLLPLTRTQPKCLVNVAGKPMMAYQLDAIRAAGIKECTIVVGYMAGSVRTCFGSNYKGVRLSYVENTAYDTSNNLCSLWQARTEFDDDVLLLESDLVFDDRLICALIEMDDPNVAVVDRFRPGMDGSVILSDGVAATALVLKSDQFPGFDYRSALKTVNIYRLSRKTLVETIVPGMEEFLGEGRTDQYYEAVFASLIKSNRMDMSVMHTGNMQWSEIDTLDDLRETETMLQSATPANRLDRPSRTALIG
jgi:NDP-sugar pyrophosphorylase family protein